MPTEDELLQQEIERARQMVPAAVLPTLARGSPDDGTRPGWLGLLGESLGGGQGAGYQLRGQEEDAAGSRALLNFGIQTLLASGPSSRRPDVLGSVAHGLQGAQQSLGVDQKRGQSRAESEYSGQLDRAKLAQMQNQGEVARLRTLIPLLKLQDERTERRRIQNLPPPWQTSSDGSGGSTGQQTSAVTPLVRPNLPDGVSPEEDQAVLTVWGEARGEPVEGQRAVAAVIKNRMAGGKSVGDVVFAQGQFEPWSNPAVRGQMEKLDPKSPEYQAILNGAVRPVMRGEAKDPTGGATYFYSPTAQAALNRETPGFAVGREPTKVIGRHNFYGGGPAAPPAPTAATPRRPPLPPAADVAPTGAVVAGPGAQPGAVQPPSPEVAGNVAAMVRGMVGAGADPTTLSPGPGGGAGGAQVAQAGQGGQPDAVTPPGAFAAPLPGEDFDTYRKRNQVPPTPEQQREIAGIQAAKRTAMSNWQNANTIADKNKASAEYAAAVRAEGEAIAKIGTGNEDRLFKIWERADTAHRSVQDKIAEERRAAAQKAEESAAEHQRKIDLAERAAAQTRLTNAESVDVARQEKRMEQIDTAAGAARDGVNDLEMLRALSTTVGKVDPWTQLPVMGTRIQDWMVRLGAGTPEQIAQMGNQQAYEAAANKIVLTLKQGTSMGALSDRDLDFLKAQAPSLLSRPETRANVIGFLEMAFQRKMDFAQAVSRHYRPGKVSVAEAEAKADAELGPLLKQPPAYSNLPEADRRKAQILWLYNNVAPGSLFKDREGKLRPYNPPPGWQPEGTE